MSIKNVSSSNKTRINNMFVNRASKINQVNSIQPIRKINQLNNNTFQSSQNTFFGASDFYEHLKKLKEEYLHFYRVQQELEDTLKKFIHPIHEDFIIMIKELVSKYNKAIISLKDFDHNFNTNHCENIHTILLSYALHLEKIGITLQKYDQLSIDEKLLSSSLKEDPHAIQFLFDTKNGFIRKLYHAFKEIKVSNYNEPYNLSSEESPFIINEKR